MALSQKELNQLVEDTARHDPFRTWVARDDQMFYRSLYVKHDPQLLALREMYERKFERLKNSYDSVRQGLGGVPEANIEEALKAWENKLVRIAEKYRDTLFEIRGRELGNFKRDPIGTEYFIDLSAGDDGNTGLSIAQAWLTIQKYTSVTVRSPGDIAWVRAGTEQVLAADIIFDEDGLGNNQIHIIGCSSESGEDPWGDASDTKPISNANAGDRIWNLDGDVFWRIKNFVIRNSTAGTWNRAPVHITDCQTTVLENVVFRDHTSTSYGAIFNRGSNDLVILLNCKFLENRQNIQNAGVMRLWDCELDGHSSLTSYATMAATGLTYFYNCSFGQTVAFTLEFGDCRFYCLGCVSRTAAFSYSGVFEEHTFTHITSSSYRAQTGLTFLEKETTIVRPGGTDHSIKATSNTGIAWPTGGFSVKSIFCGFRYTGEFHPWKIWLEPGDYTIKIFIRGAPHTAVPRTDELYIEALYFGETVGKALTRVVSDEQITTDDTWVAFEVAVSPGQASFVYLDLYYFFQVESVYPAIYIDPSPTVTEI